MRAGHEHDLLPVAIAAASSPLVDEERVAAAFDFVFDPIQRDLELIHVLRQTVGRCHLGHRPVIRRVPGLVISGVTRAARVRADITSDLRFDGTIRRRLRFPAKIMKRNQRQAACACYSCENQQPLAPGSRQLWHNFSCKIMEIETQRQICILFNYPPREGHSKSENSVIVTAASDDRALPAKTAWTTKNISSK